MADCCLIKKVATVEVYENKNEVRAYGFMAGDRNTPVMEVRFKHLWGESNLSSCKLRWIIVDDVGSLLVGEVPIQSDNTALINLPNELFTGDRRMKVQLTVASCDGERILNLQQFTDLKVVNSLAPNEVVEPVYDILINKLYDETFRYLKQLDDKYNESVTKFTELYNANTINFTNLYDTKYASLNKLYLDSRRSLEDYMHAAENGGNANSLQGNLPRAFSRVENTIEELVNSANSKYREGDVVELLGYYTAGDGAGHKRKIEQTDDGSGVQLANGLWANIVHNGEVNVSWFGAKGDGVTDDTGAIQKSINLSKVINFSNREYMINATRIKDTSIDNIRGLEITENDKILNFNKSVLRCIPNDSDKYTVLFVSGKNIELNTPNIVGDRDNHITTPSTDPKNVDGFSGEFGHGLYLRGCKNVIVNNPIVTKCWGDSFIIAGDCEDVVLKNPIASHSRRQGITIGSVKNIKIISPTITNISGTQPQSAIDIEPNFTTENLDGVYIDNLRAFECAGNSLVMSTVGDTDLNQAYINVTNVYSRNTKGVRIHAKDDTKNKIVIGTMDIEDLEIVATNSDNIICINKLFLNNRIKIGRSSNYLGGVITKTPIIKIGYYYLRSSEKFRVIGWDYPSETIPNLKECRITFEEIYTENNFDILTESSKIFLNIKKINTEYTNDTATSTLNLFRAKNVILNKPVDCLFSLNLNSGIVGTDSIITNKSTKNISFRPLTGTTLNGGSNVISVSSYSMSKISTLNGIDYFLEKIYETTGLQTDLNTPYHTLKMQQEGVYDDFINYMDEKTEYDRVRRELEQQRQLAFEQRENQEQTYEEWLAEQPMLLPVVEEPQPSEKLLAFKEKYLG